MKIWATACVPVLLAGLGCSQAPFDGTIIDPAPLPRMEISSGPQDFQVVQRDASGFATLRFEGTCKAAGEVWARVSLQPEKVQIPEHLDWHVAGQAGDGKWQAAIANVPTGGPYTVQLNIRGQSDRPLEAGGVAWLAVGDLWLLAGQSNMHGCGAFADLEPPSRNVHSFQSNETWAIAEEPLHRLNESPDACHHPGKTPEQIEKARRAPRGPLVRGAGLGLPFAKELYARTKVPIGLVPCAHGGTSMEQWDPAKYDPGKPEAIGRSLYGSMLRRFRAVGGKVKGVLWYQGESDANDRVQSLYRERMVKFIETVRRDFQAPDLPFYIVQISRVTREFSVPAWCGVREDERIIGQTIPSVVTVSAIDLELDDPIHIGTEGLKRLGRRLAIVADGEVYGNKSVTSGPRLKSVSAEKGVVRVVFENVNGRLLPAKHIAGFSLRDADGKPAMDFFDVMVDPNSPDTVLCQLGAAIPAGMNLWYGYGTNPYCNLVDEQDLAVAAFGPIPLTPAATQAAP